MLNREIYAKDPLANQIANNGVAEVKDDQSAQALKTLRYELETFVCDGEYERGLDQILDRFIENVEQGREQPGVWISGFYGSGKSHLAKMLRSLWIDFDFSDGTTARGIAQLPRDIQDSLKRLSNESRKHGGLHAASGTLGQGVGDQVRLALLGIVFKSAGLPELYHIAQFVIWLKEEGIYDQVRKEVESKGKTWDREINSLLMSSLIHRAVLRAKPELAKDEQEIRSLIKDQFKRANDVSNDEMVSAIKNALSKGSEFPLTLIVLDEVQQYIGDNSDRAYQVQEAVEACSKHFKGRLLFVGTGQNALSGTTSLSKLMGRFQLPVQLSDTDVEAVIRKIILQKKSSCLGDVEKVLQENLGEVSRHLEGSKLAHTTDDESVMVLDYPILPARRRFWEKVLRVIDTTGTVSQLRNQLKVIHEATKRTAELPLGHVVTGDFIYGQQATTLLQNGVISKEVNETITKLDNGSSVEKLRAKILSLVFLIGKLPTETTADSGIRATAQMVADLLVEDITQDSSDLRRQVAEQLDALQQAGTVMAMTTATGDTEYRLQTRESSEWHDKYRQHESEYSGNPQRIEVARDELLRTKVRQVGGELRLTQGSSRESRKLELCFEPELPRDADKKIYAWIQNGWKTNESSYVADARGDDKKRGTLYVYIPAHNRDEINRAIVTAKAAETTLSLGGTPSSPEGKDARAAMETRRSEANKMLESLLDEVFKSVQVRISGGTELDGDNLKQKLEAGMQSALARVYSQFDVSDSAAWSKVLENARKAGGETALKAVNHAGDADKYPVCAQILRYIGSGKKGNEIRENFQGAPFGWSQDAIDGALYALLASGHLKAKNANHEPVTAASLERKALTQTTFDVENVTVTTKQKLDVRRLLVSTVGCNPGEEESKIAEFLAWTRDLADKAGGSPPLPHKPDLSLIDEIAGEAGNSRIVKLFDHREQIETAITRWQAQAQQIEERRPDWDRLQTLITLSRGLSFHDDLKRESDAIANGRRLTDPQNPVETNVKEAADNLRASIQHHFDAYKLAFADELVSIESDENWCKLDVAKQEELLSRRGLNPPKQPSLNSTDEIIDSLEACSIDQWVDRTAAVHSKFESAREEAAKLLMPKAVRANLPRGTLSSDAEIQAWLQEAEKELQDKLKQGPVLVG